MNNSQLQPTLLRLTSIDCELLRLQTRYDVLPQKNKLADLDKKKADLDERAQQLQQMRTNLDNKLESLNAEGELVQERIILEQGRMEENSANYKEVARLSAEIETLTRRLEKLDYDSNSLQEKCQELKGVQAELEKRQRAIADMEEQLQASWQADGTKLLEEIEQLGTERQALGTTLPAEIWERYEASRAKHNGIGAAALQEGLCDGCHMSLTEGQLARVRQQIASEGVGECPCCHRMLVLP
ncbi:MAG: hypothetical protein FWF71_04625 [Actinomycetia bacterium]|nr:hypothetical protein [Actinomycetes bacterium]